MGEGSRRKPNRICCLRFTKRNHKRDSNMRSLLGIIIGIFVYVIAAFLFLLFFYWFFDKPHEWSYFIPIATAAVSVGIAATTAETISDNKKMERSLLS